MSHFAKAVTGVKWCHAANDGNMQVLVSTDQVNESMAGQKRKEQQDGEQEKKLLQRASHAVIGSD